MNIDTERGAAAVRPLQLTGLIVVAVALLAAPLLDDVSLLLSLSLICALSILALSMSFLWGYAGMLSFGQTLFFGLGGYAFAIVSLNEQPTLLALACAVLIPAVVGAVLGYFMIYGRISDIYLSVMTLVMTLIFEKIIRSTSGPEYAIGAVRLNGQNGIPNIPGLQLPGMSQPFDVQGVFYLSAAAMIFTYVVFRVLLGTSYGRILVGIRENETRMQLMGYDARRYKLAAFVMCAAFGGLSGAALALWGNFVSPEMFSLAQAAQVVIWVIVGGRSTLIGPILGVAFIQTLSNWLGTNGVGQVNIILGAILIVVVLALPAGLLPTLASAAGKLAGLRARRRAPGAEQAPAGGDRA